MIRAFGLLDISAVRPLQRSGVWLDLYHFLIHQRSALSTALIAPVPWWGTGLASYVWQTDQGLQGFVQMLRRPSGLEADLLFISPGLQDNPTGPAAWEALLAHCGQSAGEQGMRRLFGSLPQDSAEIDVLAPQGFGIYTNETIFRLQQVPAGEPLHCDQIRAQQEEDAWWLRRLYGLYTPSPVQTAEGLGDKDEPTALSMAWWELGHQQSYVLERGGEVQGGLHVVSGRRGHWLVLHGDPGDSPCMAALLREGLNALHGTPWPVYCAVRDYQGGLTAILQDHGFQPFLHRSRLVKHLAQRVKAAEPAVVPTLAVRNFS